MERLPQFGVLAHAVAVAADVDEIRVVTQALIKKAEKLLKLLCSVKCGRK